jgi:hypothetical protein
MSDTQVEGTTTPEAMPVEGVVPEAEVLERAASEPEVTIAPEATEEVRDDPRCGDDLFGANVRDRGD